MPIKNQTRSQNTGSGSSQAGNTDQHGKHSQTADFQTLTENVCTAVESYGRQHPMTAATMLFFLGFYVGWKVKPW